MPSPILPSPCYSEADPRHITLSRHQYLLKLCRWFKCETTVGDQRSVNLIFNTATLHLIRGQTFSKFTTLRTRFSTLSAQPVTWGARPMPRLHPQRSGLICSGIWIFFFPPPFFYAFFLWFQYAVKIKNHSFKVFLYKACSKDLHHHYHLGAGEKSRTSGPTPHLLNQNLHFN